MENRCEMRLLGLHLCDEIRPLRQVSDGLYRDAEVEAVRRTTHKRERVVVRFEMGRKFRGKSGILGINRGE